MLFSWIIKSVPRSVKAFLALLVVIGGLALIFTAVAGLFMPGTTSNGATVLKLVVGLTIVVPSVVLFYWFQNLDDKKRHEASQKQG